MKNKSLELPSVLYHGTNFEFDSFDRRHLGRAVKNPTVDFGFYFSEDEEDAMYWAFRHQDRGGPKNAFLLEVSLEVHNLREVSIPKFNFYLSRARLSTIQRDRQKMIDGGHDGFFLVRDGVLWVSVFDPKSIRILRRTPYEHLTD